MTTPQVLESVYDTLVAERGRNEALRYLLAQALPALDSTEQEIRESCLALLSEANYALQLLWHRYRTEHADRFAAEAEPLVGESARLLSKARALFLGPTRLA